MYALNITHSLIYVVMLLWGVPVLDLDSQPDQNNGPDSYTLRIS